MTRIFVHYEGDFELTPEEVWPDGDAPEEITVDDVVEVMSKDDIITDWLLVPTVVVQVNGEFREFKA